MSVSENIVNSASSEPVVQLPSQGTVQLPQQSRMNLYQLAAANVTNVRSDQQVAFGTEVLVDIQRHPSPGTPTLGSGHSARSKSAPTREPIPTSKKEIVVEREELELEDELTRSVLSGDEDEDARSVSGASVDSKTYVESDVIGGKKKQPLTMILKGKDVDLRESLAASETYYDWDKGIAEYLKNVNPQKNMKYSGRHYSLIESLTHNNDPADVGTFVPPEDGSDYVLSKDKYVEKVVTKVTTLPKSKVSFM
jgi:hypothetical protein